MEVIPFALLQMTTLTQSFAQPDLSSALKSIEIVGAAMAQGVALTIPFPLFIFPENMRHIWWMKFVKYLETSSDVLRYQIEFVFDESRENPQEKFELLRQSQIKFSAQFAELKEVESDARKEVT